MSDLTLVIGNKNTSSWSFRPWLLMKQFGIPFQEVSLKLFTPEFASSIGQYSPSGKVPVLNDMDLRVWDTLSIAEYLAEKFPEKHLWPKDKFARAHARSVCSEMHSSFSAMRTHMSMNFTGKVNKEIPTDAIQDTKRVSAIWMEYLKLYGGPFLFGKDFSIADAFYAPVVSRFLTYGIQTIAEAQQYLDTISALPAYKEWGEGAKAELA